MSLVQAHAVAPTRRIVRELAVTMVAWAVVGGAASVLRAVASTLAGRPAFASTPVDAALISLWACVTPLVLRSARRFPVRGPSATRNAMLHLAMGGAFVVATNVVIRLPILAEHGGAVFARNLGLGLATFFPTAIISYGVLVAIGHRVFATPVALDSPIHAPVSEPEPAAPADRLVIREWNRVHFIDLDTIEWIEADNNHVVVHAHERTYKGRERLSDVESRLDGLGFLRVHRSALVRIARIREVQPLVRGDQAVILHSGKVVRVARSRRQALADALGVGAR
jgi:hypothetical protein